MSYSLSMNTTIPDIVFELFRHIIKSKKVISLDIAEYNPLFDIDNLTAKLASVIIYNAINSHLSTSSDK